MIGSRRLQSLAVLSLVCVALAAPAGAAPILSGETKGGTLSSGNGREESWEFTGAAGQRVVIATAQYSGSIQPEIYLYQQDGGALIGSAAGSFPPYRLDRQLPADGAYTITVRDYGLNGDGAYTIAFANLSGTLTSASDADGGDVASGQSVGGTIYGYADLDLFRFDGTLDDRIVVTVVGTGPQPPQPALFLFPPNGLELEASHDINVGTWRVEWRLKATGTYTIVVSDWGLNTDGAYSLAFAKIPGAATSAGDTDGGTIASGETKYGTVTPVVDTDLFQFAGTAGERVVITTANLSGTVQPDIFLYPPGGQPLESSNQAALYGHTLEWVLQQSGTYTVLVSDNGLNAEGGYSVSLAKIPGNATSPGDADGGVISSGETKVGYLSNKSDTDIFQFTGSAGELVMLAAAIEGSGIQPVLRVYPPSGPAEVEALDGLTSRWLQFSLLQSGTYTVVVSDYNLDGSGSYSLSLAKLPGAIVSAGDPDGGTIESGGTKECTINYNADADIFVFHGTAGNTVVLAAATRSGSVQPHIRLFSPSGALEQSLQPTLRSTRENWQLNETGVYTVVVSDVGLNASGMYALSLVQVPGGISPPDDESDNDGGLLLHAETKVGGFHRQPDQDVYHFYGKPGERITITAGPYSSSVQPEIYLYPPGGGVPEKSATGTNMPQKLLHTLLKKGLYTIVVSDNNLDSMGYYSVLLSKSAATLTPGIYNSFPPQGTTTLTSETRFRWDAVPGASGYDFYYGTDPLQPPAFLGTVAGNSRPFPQRALGQPYYWRVVARTSAGLVPGPFNWFTFMAKPAIHRDDFTDGSKAGDPDWLPYAYASWHVNPAKQLYSTANVDNRTISRDFSNYLTGKLQSRVMLTGTPSAANASLLFSYQGDHQRYRYVKLLPGKIVIGQAGNLGGQTGGIKKTIAVPTVVKKWYTLRVDLDSVGTVKVYLNGVFKGSFKFKKAIAGWIGFGAYRSQSYFDNFYCEEATIFP